MKRFTQQPVSPRRVLTLLGIGTAVSLLGDATLYTVLPNPTISAEVGVSLGMVGILLGANRATRLLFNGPVGLLYDRMPRRGLLVASLVLGTLANISYALGFGFIPILVGRITWGAAWSMLWIGGNAVMLDISGDDNRGRYSGRYQMWFLFGIAFSSFVGAYLTDTLGFRGAMWLTTGVIGAAALLWLAALPETRPSPEHGQSSSAPALSNQGIPWRFVAKAAIPVFLTRFIGWGVLAATMILWLSGFIGESLQLGGLVVPLATVTGAVTALTMLFGMGVAPAAGWVSDKLGRRWAVLTNSIVLGSIGVWLMSSGRIGLGLLGAFMAQITGGSVETLIPAITGDSVGKQIRGRTLGMINTFGDLGAMLGPPAALGLLNAEALPLVHIYRLCAGLLLLLAGFTWIVSKRKRSLINLRDGNT